MWCITFFALSLLAPSFPGNRLESIGCNTIALRDELCDTILELRPLKAPLILLALSAAALSFMTIAESSSGMSPSSPPASPFFMLATDLIPRFTLRPRLTLSWTLLLTCFIVSSISTIIQCPTIESSPGCG